MATKSPNKFPYTRSPKGFKAKLSKNIFFMGTHFFFSNSNRDFYSQNNNVSQEVYTYIPKIQKKKIKKRYYRLYSILQSHMLLFLICFSS
jgi:hypothetical protein